jgi:DNA-binding FrmR family transcriptional regulator
MSATTTGDGVHPGYTEHKDAHLKRLRRIEGQVRGIARMVEEDVYCIDVLTQVSAVTSALHSVSLGLLEDHIGHCVVDAAKESDEAGAEKVSEAARAIARLVRS